jgi:hypothetical protein
MSFKEILFYNKALKSYYIALTSYQSYMKRNNQLAHSVTVFREARVYAGRKVIYLQSMTMAEQ